MANAYIGIKNSIKPFNHVANISMITNISFKCANDTRIDVIDFGKENKLCESQHVFLGIKGLAIDPVSFRDAPGCDWKCWNALNQSLC